MTNYYYHDETKRIFLKLDSDLVVRWEDRDKWIDDVEAFVPIYDFVEDANYFVEYNDFEEEFFPLYEGFFEEWELYALDLDELQVRKLKKLFDELVESNKKVNGRSSILLLFFVISRLVRQFEMGNHP